MFLVVDIEATCWENPTRKDLNEIIEIGIVACDAAYNRVDSFYSTVRPVINQTLSPECQKLTGIEQEDVDKSHPLSGVVAEISEWMKSVSAGAETRWGSWGNFDMRAMNKDCERHKVPPFLGDNHVNLEKKFCSIEKIRGISLLGALERKGMTFDGKPHHALNDAMNLQKLVGYILSAKAELS